MFPKLVYLDGQIIPYKKAAIPVLAHGFYYGDSAFGLSVKTVLFDKRIS